jgi:hypothetical protein
MSNTIPSLLRTACAAAALLGTAGCATLGDDSRQQQLEVHTILDHREVAGIGCVLANDAGRWFVVAPGRVTVARSKAPLTVDCAREGSGSAVEQVASRFDTGRLIGNVAVSAGVGYLVDSHSGAGFAYPATLTVMMQGPQGAQAAPDGGAPAEGTPLF